eukprot:gb/GFBE01072844.1/.p1 GENE.gb/GFBE01072844.1/~~gb/GFBE01072844.1/.p1  ORF type:complete len:237 (+),score=30.40 gb/GFBE01072844.1/:1-711(+)
MPQACRPRRLGVALDFDMTKTPAPVYMEMQKNNSREYRAGVRDFNNMLLAEARPVNDLDPRHWQGNGFAGHVQYVPYLGKEPLRPGVKFERDIQMNTMPREQGKPLNVSQMTRSAGMLNFVRDVEEHEKTAHDAAMSSMRTMRSVACESHRAEDGHNFYRNQVELNQQRQERIKQAAEALPGLRSAGLASINPRMGTCGSLPDLTRLRSHTGNHQWRTSTPWAQGGDWGPESAWHA